MARISDPDVLLVIDAARALLADYDAHRKGSERPSMEALRAALAALDTRDGQRPDPASPRDVALAVRLPRAQWDALRGLVSYTAAKSAEHWPDGNEWPPILDASRAALDGEKS